MKEKWKKALWGSVGAMVAGVALMLSVTVVGHTAISQLVGLAVAQSSTLWNNVKDAAVGDAISNGILVQSMYLFNGTTFDRVRGTNGSMNVTVVGAITPADAYANPTTAIQVWSLNGVFNGTTWDRQREPTADALAVTGLSAAANQVYNGATWDRVRSATGDGLASTGLMASGNMVYNSGAVAWDRMRSPAADAASIGGMISSGNMIFNSATWDRVRSPSADGLSQTGLPAAGLSLFNGTTWDRQDGISAANNIAATTVGVAYNAPLSTWSVTDTPAVATAAVASKAAGAATIRHVATSVTVCVAANGTAQTPLLIHLRDGATGAGTIIRTWAIAAIISTSQCVDISGLNMTGTANTAMTLETAAAPATAVQATVTLTGYSTP